MTGKSQEDKKLSLGDMLKKKTKSRDQIEKEILEFLQEASTKPGTSTKPGCPLRHGLASVLATQPCWVAGAQPTYNQWVELAALLAIASLPTGGWSGLDFFLGKWLGKFCPLSGCCRTDSHA